MSAYEAYGIRDDSSCFGVVGFEREADEQEKADGQACAVAEYYAKLWKQAAAIRLYRLPQANMSSVSSFNLWPGQVLLIAEIPGEATELPA